MNTLYARCMKTYKHLFFDMDATLAPFRQPILSEMFDLVSGLSQDIIIVSGQSNDKIEWQSNNLRAIRLGQNGNHGQDYDGTELWNKPLTENERAEILQHIKAITALLPDTPNPEWNPIEDRGAQITFSPIGNTAPVAIKSVYDPDRKKRAALLAAVPLVSDTLTVKFGGSTSLDYFPKERHKGFNVQKIIDLKDWENDDCIYFGDGLFPGGNDEAVIGVIETVAVENHIETFDKLKALLDL